MGAKCQNPTEKFQWANHIDPTLLSRLQDVHQLPVVEGDQSYDLALQCFCTWLVSGAEKQLLLPTRGGDEGRC